jgi:hypothetical protein
MPSPMIASEIRPPPAPRAATQRNWTIPSLLPGRGSGDAMHELSVFKVETKLSAAMALCPEQSRSCPSRGRCQPLRGACHIEIAVYWVDSIGRRNVCLL